MKKIFCLMVALAMLLSLTGCLSASEQAQRREALNVIAGGGDTVYALSTGTTVDNTAIYDDGSISIQLAGIQGSPTKPELIVAIKNGTRDTISLSVESLAYNGWQMDAWSDLYEITSHSVVMGTVECSSDLLLCGISDIANLELRFSIYDSDYNTIAGGTFYSNSSNPEADSDHTPAGITLMDDDSCLVTAEGFSTDSSGTELRLYMENRTERDVYLTTAKVRLNGEPAELWFWNNISGGNRIMLSEGIYAEDGYEGIALADGDVLSFDLELIDYDSGVTLSSQSVTLSPMDFQTSDLS